MTGISEVIDRYRVWEDPQVGSDGNPFTSVCMIDGPALAGERDEAWSTHVPNADAAELWEECREARLFEDAKYGQWGLLLLSPLASVARTDNQRASMPEDFKNDDLVIGEFLGDSEVLVLAPSEKGQNRVLVALPLDPRSEWYAAGDSLADFLIQYLDSRGDKYWEKREIRRSRRQ